MLTIPIVRRALPVAITLLCLGSVKLLWDQTRTGCGDQAAKVDDLGSPGGEECDAHSGFEDLLLVLKTGSSEIYEKLPMHLATTFLCFPDYLVYSDLEQYFGPVHVLDAVALVSESFRDTHPDMAQYRLLQRHVQGGADAAQLKGEESWRLDKWKFLPMINDAYNRSGGQKKWLVFIEADTYLSVHNLMLWLDALDPSAPVYAGAQVMIGDTEFAHGGSGFALSSAAAKSLTETYGARQLHWESELARQCCGDKLLADVLLEASPAVELHLSFPIIQGETLASLDWSPAHWCRPAVTWHHADAAGIDNMWQFERRWRQAEGTKRPILFTHYFAAFIWPRITAANGVMHDWDNLSNDWSFERGKVVSAAYENASACEALCGTFDTCLQWTWSPGMCRAGKTVRLGWALGHRPDLGSAEYRAADPGAHGTDGAVSGWLLDRITAFKAAIEPCDVQRLWNTHEQ